MSEENPWQTLSTRLIYQNEWIKVREDQVTRPDGNKGIYGVVETRTATGVVALSKAKEVYLVGQYRYPTECYSWEIIEGGAEKGQDPLEAAKRELKEEAGLEASSWELLTGDIQLSNCFSSELGYIYVAQGIIEGEADPDPTEVLTIRKLPLEEAIAMVNRGEITDAISMIGLLAVERWLSR